MVISLQQAFESRDALMLIEENRKKSFPNWWKLGGALTPQNVSHLIAPFSTRLFYLIEYNINSFNHLFCLFFIAS